MESVSFLADGRCCVSVGGVSASEPRGALHSSSWSWQRSGGWIGWNSPAGCLALELTSDYVVKPRCVSVFGGRIRCCHLFGRRPVFGSLIFLGVVSVSNWHRNFTPRRSGREIFFSQFHTHTGLMILPSFRRGLNIEDAKAYGLSISKSYIPESVSPR